MLKQFRQHFVQQLWEEHCRQSKEIQLIKNGLKLKGVDTLLLDHFAVIDLPGPHSGIPQLTQLFASIGYAIQGRDYLPDKQNDFLWMAETDSHHQAAVNVLPQVVVADFRMDELTTPVKKIVEKYAKQATPLPLNEINALIAQATLNDSHASAKLHLLLKKYLAGRDWPLPTAHEFHTVHEFNELLSWVLIFGRKPNHFTLSIHLLNQFKSLAEFHQFITHEMNLTLNREGGEIKGGRTKGIAQGSTVGQKQPFQVADGMIDIAPGFVEFVWRYPLNANPPIQWNDYFTGFIAQHADYVIESLLK